MSEQTVGVRLRGRRVLVAEDEYFLAKDLSDALANAGAEVIGPSSAVEDIRTLLSAEIRIDCAVLDVNLGGEMVWPVVDALLARNVPVLFVTGYDAAAIPAAYARIPRCEKPPSMPALLSIITQCVSKS